MAQLQEETFEGHYVAELDRLLRREAPDCQSYGEPRSSYIGKLVEEDGISCYIALDRPCRHNGGRGALLLHFRELDQRVQIPLAHGVDNLSDDRVHLARAPERLRVDGFLLFVAAKTTMSLFLLTRDQEGRLGYQLLRRDDIQLQAPISAVRLSAIEPYSQGGEEGPGTGSGSSPSVFTFLGLGKQGEVVEIEVSLEPATVSNGHQITVDIASAILAEQQAEGIISRAASFTWGKIFGQASEVANGQPSSSLATKPNVFDILYDPANQNIFCVTSEKVTRLRENEKREIPLETDLARLIQQEFDACFNADRGGRQNQSSSKITNQQYLGSDLAQMRQNSETKMVLSVFVNLRIQVSDPAGWKPQNRLARYTVTSESSIEGGPIEQVDFLEVPGERHESLLDSVEDAVVLRHFRQNGEVSHVLIMEQKLQKQIVMIEIGQRHKSAQPTERIQQRNQSLLSARVLYPGEILVSACLYIPQITNPAQPMYGRAEAMPQEQVKIVTNRGIRELPLEAVLGGGQEETQDPRQEANQMDGESYVAQPYPLYGAGISPQEQLLRILEDYSNIIEMQQTCQLQPSPQRDQAQAQSGLKRMSEMTSRSNNIDEQDIARQRQELAAIVARARALMATGSQGRAPIVDTLKSILLECLDSRVEESTFTRPGDLGGASEFNDHGLILQNIANKEKQIDMIASFVRAVDLRVPEHMNGLDVHPQKLSARQEQNEAYEGLTKQIIDFKIKVATAKNLRQSEQSIISNRNPAEIEAIQTIMRWAAEEIYHDDREMFHGGISTASAVFSRLSQIDVFVQRILASCLSETAHQSLSIGRKELIRMCYLRLLKPLLGQLLELFATLHSEHQEGAQLQNQRQTGSGTSFCQIRNSFVVDSSLLDRLVAFASLLEELEDCQAMLLEYAEMLLDYLRAAKLDQEAAFAERWAHMRDTLVLKVYMRGRDSRITEALRLSKKFAAQQMLVKVVFESGPQHYPTLYEQIEAWGDNFLLLSFRVVYILEKRRLQNSIQNEAEYQGFEMFNIFESRYYTQLENFLNQRNKNMLILLKAKNAADQQQPAREQSYREVNELVQFKLSGTNVNQTTKALASIGEIASDLSHAQTQFQLTLPEKELHQITFTQATLLDLRGGGGRKSAQANARLNDFDAASITEAHFLEELEQDLATFRTKPHVAFIRALLQIERLLGDDAQEQARNTSTAAIWQQVLALDAAELKNLSRMLPSHKAAPGETVSSPSTEKQIEEQIQATQTHQILSFLEEESGAAQDRWTCVQALIDLTNSGLDHSLRSALDVIHTQIVSKSNAQNQGYKFSLVANQLGSDTGPQMTQQHLVGSPDPQMEYSGDR